MLERKWMVIKEDGENLIVVFKFKSEAAAKEYASALNIDSDCRHATKFGYPWEA